MADLEQPSRHLAAGLGPGEHRLTDQRLQDLYGIDNVTPENRGEIAEQLTRAGLQITSDPRNEPLMVRQTQTERPAATRVRRRVPWYRRRWVLAIAGVFLLLLVIGALISAEDDGGDPATGPATTKTPAPPTETATPEPVATPEPEPTETFEDAEQAVERDQYRRALSIGADLSSRQESRIRRRVSRRLATRARNALSNGNRSQARRLVRQAAQYPFTPEIRSAQTALTAATERAAERRRQREIDRQQAEAEREAEQAAPEPEAAPEPDDLDEVPSGTTCADTPETDFPVPPGDPRDRDNDGIACESYCKEKTHAGAVASRAYPRGGREQGRRPGTARQL